MWNKLGMASVAAALCTSASAVQVAWGDWWNAEGLLGAYIDTPTGTVTALHGGALAGLMNCGIDRWAVGNYIGDANRPTCKGPAMYADSENSVLFSSTVQNPYMALMGWNVQSVVFDAPFELVSIGSGYYGEGTMTPNGDSTGFTGHGEVHAVIRFNGSFDAIGFEAINWANGNDTHRAYTVGLATLPPVPEPGSWALMALGLGLVGTALRRRQQPAMAPTGHGSS